MKTFLYRMVPIVLLIVFVLPLMPVSRVFAEATNLTDSGSLIEIAPHMSTVLRTKKAITRVVVAQPKLADVDLLAANQLLIVAQSTPGTTSLILWHGEEETEIYRVRVRLDDTQWKEIQAAINHLVPEARVRVERLGEDKVCIHGTVESQKDLDRVVEITKGFVSNFTNMITLQGFQQVQLEVKVAEVSRSGMRQMGLGFLIDNNFKAALTPSGSIETAMEGGGSLTATSSTDRSSSTYSSMSSSASLSSPYSSAFQILLHSLDRNYLVLLNLLKSQGLSRLLASPTLVTMNGQKAEFIVGGEFPYPFTEDGETSIQFKQFGIALTFTPYIVDKETITLVVEPEVSALDYSTAVVSGGTSVPGISTRRTQSTIQLKDGQAFAIAGLLREETAVSVNKVPFLGDIPVLGSLFTSKSQENRETELVVVVCPRIVTAVSARTAPALPGVSFERGTGDVGFFLLNRGEPAEKPAGGDRAVPYHVPKFRGEIGFSQ